MNSPSSTRMQDLKHKIPDPRDSLLESLDHEERNINTHERNLRKMFRGTCGPFKDIPNKNSQTTGKNSH